MQMAWFTVEPVEKTTPVLSRGIVEMNKLQISPFKTLKSCKSLIAFEPRKALINIQRHRVKALQINTRH